MTFSYYKNSNINYERENTSNNFFRKKKFKCHMSTIQKLPLLASYCLAFCVCV